MDVQARLQVVFRDVFGDEALVIRREMTAADVEDWDSLSHINLLVAVEKEFKIRFDLAEVKSLKNVGEMMDLIARKAG
jgi:acyl carrier protein